MPMQSESEEALSLKRVGYNTKSKRQMQYHQNATFAHTRKKIRKHTLYFILLYILQNTTYPFIYPHFTRIKLHFSYDRCTFSYLSNSSVRIKAYYVGQPDQLIEKIEVANGRGVIIDPEGRVVQSKRTWRGNIF